LACDELSVGSAHRRARDIEFKDAVDPDDRVGMIAALALCKFQCFRTVYEQSSPNSALLAGDPVPYPVAADHEYRRFQT
jgi:hypothetical protein